MDSVGDRHRRADRRPRSKRLTEAGGPRARRQNARAGGRSEAALASHTRNVSNKMARCLGTATPGEVILSEALCKRSTAMATTLRTFISLLVRDGRDPETHVHFHRGPPGRPPPCHDAGCSSPRLEI